MRTSISWPSTRLAFHDHLSARDSPPCYPQILSFDELSALSIQPRFHHGGVSDNVGPQMSWGAPEVAVRAVDRAVPIVDADIRPSGWVGRGKDGNIPPLSLPSRSPFQRSPDLQQLPLLCSYVRNYISILLSGSVRNQFNGCESTKMGNIPVKHICMTC